jgi:hypothetical protein
MSLITILHLDRCPSSGFFVLHSLNEDYNTQKGSTLSVGGGMQAAVAPLAVSSDPFMHDRAVPGRSIIHIHANTIAIRDVGVSLGRQRK